LVTFTFTQVVDIMLWQLHDTTGAYGETVGGLQACQGLQLQFGSFPALDDPQWTNFMISKFLLPMVVFSQHAMQLTYPSTLRNTPGERKTMILWRLFPCAIMSLAFGCTWLVPSPYDHAYTQKPGGVKYDPYEGGMGLHWGGDFTHEQMAVYFGWFYIKPPLVTVPPAVTWGLIQVAAVAHSGVVAMDFTRVMPPRMALVHNVVLCGVVGSLAALEGTIQLGSKWCTFCLIYSLVYTLEPLWFKEEQDEPAPVKAAHGAAASTGAASPVQVTHSPLQTGKYEPEHAGSPDLVDSAYRGTGMQLRYRGARTSPIA